VGRERRHRGGRYNTAAPAGCLIQGVHPMRRDPVQILQPWFGAEGARELGDTDTKEKRREGSDAEADEDDQNQCGHLRLALPAVITRIASPRLKQGWFGASLKHFTTSPATFNPRTHPDAAPCTRTAHGFHSRSDEPS
jgi:hypothetical protein